MARVLVYRRGRKGQAGSFLEKDNNTPSLEQANSFARHSGVTRLIDQPAAAEPTGEVVERRGELLARLIACGGS